MDICSHGVPTEETELGAQPLRSGEAKRPVQTQSWLRSPDSLPSVPYLIPFCFSGAVLGSLRSVLCDAHPLHRISALSWCPGCVTMEWPL